MSEYLEISKRRLIQLKELVRDFNDSQEAIAPGAGLFYDIQTPFRNHGMGLDLVLFNGAGVAANATVNLDNKLNVITLAPAQLLELSNILWYRCQIFRLGGVIAVDAYWAGATFELLKEVI